MNTDIKNVIIFIYKADCFLFFPIVNDLFQPVEPPHPVVNMRHIISRFQIVNFLQRKSFLAGVPIAEMKMVVTFEYLVVGIAEKFQVVVDEAFVDYVEKDVR